MDVSAEGLDSIYFSGQIGTWMLWLFTILLLFIGLLAYLLWAPFLLEINSQTGLFRVRWHRLALAQIHFTDRSLLLELKIGWWQKTLDLFSPVGKQSHAKKKKATKTGRTIPLKKLQSVLRSFKVHTFYLTLDTGNMQLNGLLYPWILWLGYKMKINISINFVGKNELLCEIENNVFRVLRRFVLA